MRKIIYWVHESHEPNRQPLAGTSLIVLCAGSLDSLAPKGFADGPAQSCRIRDGQEPQSLHVLPMRANIATVEHVPVGLR